LLSSNEIYLDNPEKAIELYNKAFAIDSTTTYVDVMNYVFFGNYDLAATFMLFDQEESLDYAEKYLEVVKIHGEYGLANMHRVGYAYWLSGYKDEAAYYFDKQVAFCINQNHLGRTWSEQLFTYYDLAGIYAFRGEKEKAYKNLRIFKQRKIMHQWMVWNIKNDPLFDKIRDEPEFQQIVKDVEAKYQAEHERVRLWLEENEMM
jgi:tetratricopeptide (TPR) repeat protein